MEDRYLIRRIGPARTLASTNVSAAAYETISTPSPAESLALLGRSASASVGVICLMRSNRSTRLEPSFWNATLPLWRASWLGDSRCHGKGVRSRDTKLREYMMVLLINFLKSSHAAQPPKLPIGRMPTRCLLSNCFYRPRAEQQLPTKSTLSASSRTFA